MQTKNEMLAETARGQAPEERQKTAEVLQREKTDAGRVYTWLLLSPLFTIPCFAIQIFDLSNRATPAERISAALIPLLCHVVLLVFLSSGHVYVRRHAQQGLILVVLRTLVGAVALFLDVYSVSAYLLVVFGSGALWLFGSLWGRNQVWSGECWLMRRRGEDAELPRPWELIDANIPETETKSEPSPPLPLSPRSTGALPPVVGGAVQTDPAPTPPTHLHREEVIAELMAMFRTGTPEKKRMAIEQLARMGQVEVF